MGCKESVQIRWAEMITFAFDSSGNLVGDPVDLSMSIDLNGASSVAVSVVPCSINLDSATSIELGLQTAAINTKGFFSAAKGGGSSVEFSFNSTGPQAQFADQLLRFLTFDPSITGTPATMATLVCTVDVILRWG